MDMKSKELAHTFQWKPSDPSTHSRNPFLEGTVCDYWRGNPWNGERNEM